jgi:hypothetical protein
MSKKPIFNPSRLMCYSRCKLKFFTQYVKHLVPAPKVEAKRELGTLGHTAEGAFDAGQSVKGQLDRRVKKFKNQRGFHIKHLPTLQQLKVEAQRIFEGSEWVDAKGKSMQSEGYESWRQRELDDKGAEFVEGSVEKRFFTDVGPVILAPQMDCVLQTYDWLNDSQGEELWSYERKYTARWQDKGWELRWKLEVQSTIHCIVIEKHFDVNCRGHMLEGVTFSRQNRKDAEEPQPISKVTRLPLRWVTKPETVRANFMGWMEALPGELAQRHKNNDWPADGAANGSCDFCEYKVMCLDGNMPLLPREIDDIDKKEGRKAHVRDKG